MKVNPAPLPQNWPKIDWIDTSKLQTLQPQAGKSSFVDMLSGGVEQVNQMRLDADDAVHQYLTGADINSAEVLTSVQKADMAFRLLTQVRNKLMSAFEELNMRI